jgi:NTE family protein
MVGRGNQRFVRVGRIIACAALVVGCTQVIHNDPINQPLSDSAKLLDVVREAPSSYDDTVIAVAFSGGGTRAAAFSYGVLQGFDETHVQARAASLLDRIDFVSGVSGGSVLAAYYGLKKRQALVDFKQRFLLANAEEGLQMDLGLLNIARGLQGGVNDSSAFPRWLDAHLFNRATFKDLLQQQRPEVWINASDIYNRTTFIFTPVTFGALCSDLSDYPISMAVAASAAVPVIFAPVVIQNYPGGCPNPLPDWVARVRNNDNAAPLIRSYADALERYHSGTIKYVKLLDGGLVDNFGLAGFTISRLASTTAYGPLAPQEAVKLKRLLFLVVDSGRAPQGAWAQTVAGPAGVDLINAASDTATESGAVGSYTTFDDTMDDWREALVKWRCGLAQAERERLGAPPGWNCKDVKFFIGRISFDELGPERAAALNAVETHLRLPPDQVDMLIDAGRDALKTNAEFRGFLRSFSPVAVPPPPQRGAPVAAIVPPRAAPAASLAQRLAPVALVPTPAAPAPAIAPLPEPAIAPLPEPTRRVARDSSYTSTPSIMAPERPADAAPMAPEDAQAQ